MYYQLLKKIMIPFLIFKKILLIQNGLSKNIEKFIFKNIKIWLPRIHVVFSINIGYLAAWASWTPGKDLVSRMTKGSGDNACAGDNPWAGSSRAPGSARRCGRPLLCGSHALREPPSPCGPERFSSFMSKSVGCPSKTLDLHIKSIFRRNRYLEGVIAHWNRH